TQKLPGEDSRFVNVHSSLLLTVLDLATASDPTPFKNKWDSSKDLPLPKMDSRPHALVKMGKRREQKEVENGPEGDIPFCTVGASVQGRKNLDVKPPKPQRLLGVVALTAERKNLDVKPPKPQRLLGVVALTAEHKRRPPPRCTP
ncbi:Vacuolar Protein Sorting-Associated Protein 13B, partial [Manis pentadactyla]